MKNHLLRPMRSGAVMCILAGSLLSAKANTYYFSSSAGDDSRTSTQAQNPSTPWKSLNKLNSFFSSLQPGDNVLFKKGETFVGKLSITRSGVSGSPITISSYGTGSAPVFEYDVANATGSISSRAIIYLQSVNFITIDGIKFTDHTLSANSIHTTRTANVGYGIDTYNCSNLAFTNLDISLIGVGIELNGNYNTISGCNIYDLGMVVNDSYTDNDYGANGIVFAGSYNTFSSNTFQNCWAVSTDYGYDGGAIELFGSVNGQTSNNMITRNKALNNQGFMELGSNSSTDVVANNQVAYNLLINNGGVFYIHNSGSFATGVSNLKFYNNNVVETVIPQSPYPYLFSAASTAPSNTLIVKNNVFWVARSLTVIRSTLSSFTHTNNIFRMSSGTLGFTLTSSELSLGLSTPMFANTSAGDPANWDYHLASASPAIDFGVDLGLTSDYFGNAVYNGKAPDASADESGGSLTVYYRDADADGYGNANDTVTGTSAPKGYVTNSNDCNDNDSTIHPGAVEICDGKDNNCDGRIDETCTYTTYYRDADQDSYGNSADTVMRTTKPAGYAAKGGDCNDNDATINPGAVEICDGKDNNCDGRIDETCTYTTYYRDADQDGYGNDADTLIRTTKPTGYAAQGGDCNDNDATINPGAVEVCDGKDNNCNGLIDEGCSSKPYITITDASIFKTPGSVTLYVRLSGAATQPVSVDYVTVNGTATSTQSYKSKSGTLTIPAGATSGTIQISIMKDKTKNPDDYFYVQMANAVNGLFADSVGKVSILDSRNLLHLFYYNRYQPFANSTTNTTGQNNALEPGVISIKAQPNPTTSYFRLVIRSNSPQPVSIRVIDMTGRMVEKQENIGANADIIVGSTLKPGFYIIQAIQGKNVTQQKVIKF